MDDERQNMVEVLEVKGTKVLVARYIYPSGAVVHVHSIVVADRISDSVKFQHGAIGFDFTVIYQFECDDGKVFQNTCADPETYYWGQELTIEELSEMPNFSSIAESIFVERFVLTEWGGVYPLNDDDRVIPLPDSFVIPPDMLA